MTKRLHVPADLRNRIREAAADMGVPPEWVLRACVEIALDGEDENVLVCAVEDVAGRHRAFRMPRATVRRKPEGASDWFKGWQKVIRESDL